ncbi:DDE superfamily endonuclease [Trichonephila clavipes]|nr:DDE superfamily endonuclease [Trichonephila clavipes]
MDVTAVAEWCGIGLWLHAFVTSSSPVLIKQPPCRAAMHANLSRTETSPSAGCMSSSSRYDFVGLFESQITEVLEVWLENARFSCQVIYSQFGLAIHQNDHQARRRFVEWAQNQIAVVPDFHKQILFSHEAHFWLNGYVNKQNCRLWSEANPQVYVETPLHAEKLTV